MENLTHSLAGWQIGQLGIFQRVGPRAGLVGLVAANLPDIDVLLYAWDQDLATWQHRGFTHSAFGFPLQVLLGAEASFRWLRTGRRRDHIALWAAGVLSHSLMDWPTTWGTQLLYPLTDHRFSAGLVFILDPAFWLLLGVLPWVLVRRRGWLRAHAAVAALCAVLGWYATAAVGKELAESQAPEPVTVHTAPLSPFRWTGVSPATPGADTHRRYFLTPTSAEAAGSFRALDADTRGLLEAHPAAERDLWMRVRPIVHHDRSGPAGRELAVVDLAYSSWLSPDDFRFGAAYVIDSAGVIVERDTSRVEGPAEPPAGAPAAP